MKSSVEQRVIMGKLSNGAQTEDCELFDNNSNFKVGENTHSYFNKLEKNFKVLQNTANNTSIKEITSNNQSIQKVVIFIKKVIRKFIKWYVEPICVQQSLYNRAVEEIIKDQIKMQSEMLAEIQKLKNELEKQKLQNTLE